MSALFGKFRWSLLFTLVPCVLFIALQLYTLRDITGNFRFSKFMEEENNGKLLIPAKCDVSRGEEGRDYVKGRGFDSGKGQRLDYDCWYSIKAFKTIFPAYANTPDNALEEERYRVLGYKRLASDPWQALFYQLIGLLLTGLVTAKMLTGLRNSRSNASDASERR